jgi:heat shock protein HtpX
METDTIEYNPLASRLARLRFSSGLVLAGFVFNAGLIVLPVAYVTHSTMAALICLGLMAVVVLVLALYAETFLLNKVGARPPAEGEYRWLRPLVAELALGAGIAVPEVLVSDDEELNAFTTGTGRRSKIVFTAGLLERLPREEVRAVAAHELGHVVNRDVSLAVWSSAISGWVSTMGRVAGVAYVMVVEFSKRLPMVGEDMGPIGQLLAFTFAVLGFMLAGLLWLVTQVWLLSSRLVEFGFSRDREFLADVTGAALVGEPLSLAAALTTLSESAGLPRGSQVVGRFCIITPAASGGGRWDDLLSTHPAPTLRIAELERLSKSPLPKLTPDWQGVGPMAWIAPVGSLAVLFLLALIVPTCA